MFSVVEAGVVGEVQKKQMFSGWLHVTENRQNTRKRLLLRANTRHCTWENEYKRNLDERRCVKRHSKENPPILTTQLKTEPVFFTLREQGYMCAKRQKNKKYPQGFRVFTFKTAPNNAVLERSLSMQCCNVGSACVVS